MIIKKKNTGLLIVYIGVIFLIILVLSKNTNLFAAGDLKTTPTWNVICGCDGNEHCYSCSYNIGELSLSAGSPIYMQNNSGCSFSGQKSYPEPNTNCWKQEFSFEGKKFTIH